MKKIYKCYCATSYGREKLLLWLCFIMLSFGSYGQQTNKKFNVRNYGDIGYLEYLPQNYSSNNTTYPVLIFLHGAGERGNGTSDLTKVKKNGPPKLIESGHKMEFEVNGKKESFIVISPQLRSNYNSWPGFYVDLVIEHVKKNYRVDLDRIYLTGLSMGGGACWAYTSYSTQYADKIAAIAPMCGHQSFVSSKVCNIASNNVAVWAHHGDSDKSTPLRYSKDWVNGVNNCSSTKQAELTIYPGAGHSDAWEKGYDADYKYNDISIYEWLLHQERGKEAVWPDQAPPPTPEPENQLPVAKAGTDKTITLPTNTTTLDGSSSSDTDGDIVSYSWSLLSGSPSAILTNQNTKTVTVSALTEGVYTFELSVQDDDGATNKDQITLVVEAAPAQEPNPSPGEVNACDCNHIITSSQPYVNGETLGVKPGDVVCIQAGDYPYLNLFNFKGSKELPLTIKNCGGEVKIGGSSANYGIVMNNNHYFRLTGTGDASVKYGFQVNGDTKFLATGFAIAGKSSDFEIDHLEITKVEAGVLAKTNPSCDASTWQGNYTMKNVKFHDIYVHDIKGEGFYIGHTSLNVNISCGGTTKTVTPHDIENIEVYNNKFANTGWDGIQVSRASKNCNIYNNEVYNYGTENKSSQQAGIIVGGESNGRVYNNWVEKGTGSGIQIFGQGEVVVFNNIVKDAGEDAIFSDDRSTSPLSLKLINNTILSPDRDGIRLYNNESDNNVVNNNLVIAPGSLGNYNNTESSYLFLGSGVNADIKSNIFEAKIDEVDFSNIVLNDYTLGEQSPAVDAGCNVEQFDISKDYADGPRPLNGAYDVGAYESSFAAEPAPTPPTENVKGLNYAYYEGLWSSLPDFSKLNPIKKGEVEDIDLSIRERNSKFAVVFTGYIDIPVEGNYTFETASDDGSKLYIGGNEEANLVVNNDGLHGKRFREGSIQLTAGLHPIQISFFEKSGKEILEVYWKDTPNGITTREIVPTSVFFREAETSPEPQIPEEPVITGTLYKINFTKSGFSSGNQEWNDIALNNITGSRTTTAEDAEKSGANITVTAYHGMSGYTILGVADNQASLSNGVFPDAIMRHAAYTTGRASIRFGSLSPDKIYNIHVYGGRAGSGQRLTEYIVAGQSKTLQCMNNSSETVVFESIRSNSNGEINLEFQQGGNTWAYINAVVVEEIDNTNAKTNTHNKVISEQLTDTKITGSATHRSSVAKVYPNPLSGSKLNIQFTSSEIRLTKISIFDQWGRKIVSDTVSGIIPNGAYTLSTEKQFLKSGMYIIKIEGGNIETETHKLLVR